MTDNRMTRKLMDMAKDETIKILSEENTRLREALKQVSSEWRDIETAPKDGTHILTGKFSDPVTIQSDYWSEFAKPDEGGCWCDWPSGFQDPTHWMPLPEPPDDGEPV